MQEVKDTEVKVGGTYVQRLNGKTRVAVKVLAVHTALGHPEVVTGFKVERVEFPGMVRFAGASTLELPE